VTLRLERPRLDELGRTLSGRIVGEGEPDMVLANKQHAAELPFKPPGALIRCRTEQDVVLSLRFLAAEKIDFSIRSGGHCFSDLSSAGAVQLDLGELNHMRVEEGLVRAGPGALAGDLVRFLSAGGLTLPTGGCPLVALGGLTLVGGFGFLGRKHGLTTDRLAWARVALADGSVVLADEWNEADLFWALRGAGSGGFGVVTELGLQPVPAEEAIVCFGAWPIEAAAEIIHIWQSWAPRTDGRVNIELSLMCPEEVDTPCYIRLYGIIFGSREERLEALVELRTRLRSLAGRLETVEMEPAPAALYAAGAHTFRGEPAWLPSRPYVHVGYQATRSNFFESELSSAAVTDLIDCFVADRGPNELREVELIPWGGAYAREVPFSCFDHRAALLLIRHTGLTGARSSAETRHRVSSWAAKSAGTVAFESNGRLYQGYAERAREDWRKAYYGASYARLRTIKANYDPHQLFSGPQMIS